MSPHRRRWLPLLLAAAVLAACGGSDDAGGDAVGSGAVAGDDSASGETVLPEPPTTEADPASEPASGSSELTQVTTTAEADEEAERTQVAPRKDVVTRSPDAVGDGNPPDDVTTALVEIVDADGEVCIVCMWLADDADERSRGLMDVYDLGVPIGMAFTWDAPTSGRFYMFDTPTPLSIAWFAPDGTYLSEVDMEPCLDETSTDCERYGTTGEYTMAIEMFQGELGKVGIGPGSTARIVEVSDSEVCPLLAA